MKRVVIAVAGLAVALTACSGKTTEADKTTSPSAAAPSSMQSSAPAPKPPVHIGATVDLTNESGAALAVTLSKIINPAKGTDGPPTDSNGNPNGSSYIATLLTVKNTGTSNLEGDVNTNTVLVGSDKQDYTADLDSVTECTNFDEGVYHLTVGEDATGCVTFVLPAGVTPSKVKYTPSSGFASDFGEWLIP